MSFNRLKYDQGAYAHGLKEAIGAGDYMISTPRVDCGACFHVSPHVRIDRIGASVCDRAIIDVDSELMGLTRKQSKCPQEKYLPCDDAFCEKVFLKDCNGLSPEETRISNPPCTLRGIENGWNRWEWMCQNPQDKAIMPFQHQINNRLIVKDNHRPCIPRPLDPSGALPASAPDTCPPKPQWDKDKVAESFVHNYPSIHWRSCQEIRNY